MASIKQIYTQYKIMPNLQLHMLRVAGVASILCDNLAGNADKNAVVTTCLLHDMGNILKFKLDVFPEFLEPEGLDYWTSVQNEFIEKYGDDEHEASLKIAKELGVSDYVVELINSISFSKSVENFEQSDINKKVCAYSDLRVAPHGITSLEKRVDDLGKRYASQTHTVGGNDRFEILVSHCKKTERQLFSGLDITPDYITNEAVEPLFPLLKSFEILQRM